MSNKGQAPKGYSERSLIDIQNECRQLVFELGQAHYNEEFSCREQSRIQERLEELEPLLKYAQEEANRKQVEENNKKVREESATKEADKSEEPKV